MLALLGYCMVAVFMALIMTKRMSALLALIIVPIIFALIGGFYTGIGDMMLEGIKQVAPTGVMLVFAILYFGIRLMQACLKSALCIKMGSCLFTIYDYCCHFIWCYFDLMISCSDWRILVFSPRI